MKIDRQQLPQNLKQCHALIRELMDDLDAKERKLQRLLAWLTKLLRWRYGPRREHVDENQLFLFAVATVETKQDVPPADATPGKKKPSPKPHGRTPLPRHLERREQHHELAEDERGCPHCPEQMRRIGEEISERLEYVPASLHVIRDICGKYACPKGCAVVTAGKPMQPIEKGLAGPGLLAHVAVNKYADHLPLYRQEGMFARQGVELSRQTLCDWMRDCAALVEPLFEQMKRVVLSSKAVQTDDTPVAVLDPAMTRTKTGRIWTYVGDKAHPYTIYDYTPDRCRDGPDRFLQEFCGYLQADAYSGYDGIYKDAQREVTEVACWAHARRKFFEAQESDIMRSMVLLAYIRLLYEVEREARDRKMDGTQRLVLRREKSVPILADIEAYLRREQRDVLPKSPMGDAIGYALNNWTALQRYTEDGDLEIDNNAAERSLRGVAVGRKNWLFFGSDAGGRTAAILTSLITTCKRLDIDPFAYLRDIFERISAHPAKRLSELLPDQWKAARATTVTC